MINLYCSECGNKLDVKDVMGLIRDHYEETEIDMTKGVAAGPYGNPNRWRPLIWELDDVEASWERCISTYNTGFSIVTQSRSWLPDEIGGLVWYGLDDSYFSCYAPVYACTEEIPIAFATGNIQEFSMESAWWVFNLVSNYTNTKYCHILKDVQSEQNRIENAFFAKQDSIESMAVKLLKEDKEKGKAFISNYSYTSLNYVFDEWTKLSGVLISKYNDGYVKDENGRPQNVGYPLDWRQKVLGSSKQYLLPVWKDSKKAAEPENH